MYRDFLNIKHYLIELTQCFFETWEKNILAYVLWPLRFVIPSLIHTYVTMRIAIRTETTTKEHPGSGRKIVNDSKNDITGNFT